MHYFFFFFFFSSRRRHTRFDCDWSSDVCSSDLNQVPSRASRKFPSALGRHIERLQSIPGAGGENTEGRSGADAEKFFALAYPSDDIALANLDAARAAAARLKGKNFPTGKGQPGTWISVGPSHALYPATIFRSSFSYVPNRYMAGGRATAVDRKSTRLNSSHSQISYAVF